MILNHKIKNLNKINRKKIKQIKIKNKKIREKKKIKIILKNKKN